MRTPLRIVIAAVLAGCGAPDSSRSAEQAPSGDEAAVEAALHGYFDAFKAQDTAAFAPYVTSDFLLYEGGRKFERFHSSWFPPIEPTSVAELEEYVGSYRGSAPEAEGPMELRVVREGERLYASRADGEPWIAGLARIELFPAGEDSLRLDRR